MADLSWIIPRYSDDCEFVPSKGRQDRILVDLDGWVVNGSPAELVEFRNSLPSVNERPDGTAYRLFTSGRGQENYWRFPISSGPHLPRPLFGGTLIVRTAQSTGLPAGVGRYRLKLQLALNPTDWLASQSTRLTQHPIAEWLGIPSRMLAAHNPYLGQEVPLVAGTNVLIGMPRDLFMAHPDRWDIQLRRYWNGLIDFVEGAFSQAASAAGCSFERTSENITLKEIETHWEFSSERPLHEMFRLERRVRQIAASSDTNWASITPEAATQIDQFPSSPSTGVEDNSPRIRMRLAAGTYLRIYAKTTQRIRFEVENKCADARSLFPQRTANNWNALFGWLDAARQDGAARLDTVMSVVRSVDIPSSPEKLPHELIADIFTAIDDPVQARGIVATLVATGRLVNYRNNHLGAAIRKLNNRHVVERCDNQGASVVYLVTLPYRNALERIRQ